MHLFTLRTAVVLGAAVGAAALAAALVLKGGKSWPAAVLIGAGAFAGAATFLNGVIS
ncbi:hypothetical protein ACFWY5_11865 [Nonomuraea sp. NPDC059007]|uniref:hypothetical protein n=1 Tax=Nonomuraea sp. NPDC059007 TaxID=3346692 RepID=UPI0036937FA2